MFKLLRMSLIVLQLITVDSPILVKTALVWIDRAFWGNFARLHHHCCG